MERIKREKEKKSKRRRRRRGGKRGGNFREKKCSEYLYPLQLNLRNIIGGKSPTIGYNAAAIAACVCYYS